MNRLSLSIIALIAVACSNAADVSAPTDARAISPPLAAESGRVSSLDLGTLGGAFSFATDINKIGTVVGWSETSTGQIHAFRWSIDRGMSDLPPLPGDATSQAFSIGDDGKVLGVSGDAPNRRPVVWSPNGVPSAVGIPLIDGAQDGQPSDFNENREYAGWDLAATGFQHGWYWSRGTGKIDLTQVAGSHEGVASRILEDGTVMGVNHVFDCPTLAECWRTYLWTAEGGLVDLGTPGNLPGVSISGMGANDRETVVGWMETQSSFLRPFRWSDDTGFEFLASLANDGYDVPMDVSNKGIIVGAARDATTGQIQAVAWPRRNQVVRLDAGSPNFGMAVAINMKGLIAGSSGGHATIWWLSGVTLQNGLTAQRLPTETVARKVGTGAQCFQSTRTIVSRQALFDCIGQSDYGR